MGILWALTGALLGVKRVVPSLTSFSPISRMTLRWPRPSRSAEICYKSSRTRHMLAGTSRHWAPCDANSPSSAVSSPSTSLESLQRPSMALQLPKDWSYSCRIMWLPCHCSEATRIIPCFSTYLELPSMWYIYHKLLFTMSCTYSIHFLRHVYLSQSPFQFLWFFALIVVDSACRPARVRNEFGYRIRSLAVPLNHVIKSASYLHVDNYMLIT